jgi:hypothetical protein
MTNFIAGIIGIAGVIAFLGVLIWWIKAPPLIIIIFFVMGLLIYDFVTTLITGDNGSQR